MSERLPGLTAEDYIARIRVDVANIEIQIQNAGHKIEVLNAENMRLQADLVAAFSLEPTAPSEEQLKAENERLAERLASLSTQLVDELVDRQRAHAKITRLCQEREYLARAYKITELAVDAAYRDCEDIVQREVHCGGEAILESIRAARPSAFPKEAPVAPAS